MITEEQRQLRKSGIGGSDIGAIMGLSSFRSPYDVYLSKVSDDDEDVTNDAIEWGNRLEAAIITKYDESLIGEWREQRDTKRHPDHEWAIANVDCVVCSDDGIQRILEIKTANAFTADKWADSVPPAYFAQCQWYMWIYGVNHADLAVLIGGSDYRVYPIPRDEDFISMMVAQAEDFWRCVVERIPPQVSTVEAAAKKYPAPTVESKEADNVALDAIVQIKQLTEQANEIDRQLKEKKAVLMDFIGEAEAVTFLGEPYATWKPQERTSLDTKRLKAKLPDVYKAYSKTSTSRVLRIR